VVALVLATHAPSETMLVSARLALGAGGRLGPAYLYLLLSAKPLHVALLS
jgi:hypothetical protein